MTKEEHIAYVDSLRLKDEFYVTKFEHKATLRELNDTKNEIDTVHDKLRNDEVELVVPKSSPSETTACEVKLVEDAI